MPSPSSAPANPDIAEINARLNAFRDQWDACQAAPEACDLNALLKRYVLTGSPAATYYTTLFNNLLADRVHVVDADKTERVVVEVNVTGSSAISELCETDRSSTVTADGALVESQPGKFREEWSWEKNEGQWLVVDLTIFQIGEQGSAVCDTALPS